MSRAVRQVKLSDQEKLKLQNLEKDKTKTRKGFSQRIFKRALVLLKADRDFGIDEIALAVEINRNTVRCIKNRYLKGGLDYVLYDQPRPGKKPILGEYEQASLIQLAREKPPVGYARWTHLLLANTMIKRGIVKQISQDVVRRFFKKKA